MAKTFLQQLYDGEIYPAEAIVCKDPEQRELSRKIMNETEYFKAALLQEDWSRLERLKDMMADRSAAYSYENFRYGFRLGVNFLMETL